MLDRSIPPIATRGLMWRHQSDIVLEPANSLRSGWHGFRCSGVDRSESHVARLASMKSPVMQRRTGADGQECNRRATSGYFSYHTPSKHNRSALFGNISTRCRRPNCFTAALNRERRHFFSATRMHTPDQRSCPTPGGGVALKGITPTLVAANGYRASR